MVLKIFWIKRALNSFENILKYIEKDFGEPTTKSFAIKVYNFVDNLEDFPELGTLQNQEEKAYVADNQKKNLSLDN